MFRYVLKRILWMIPTLLGIMFIIFTINYFTPGDPAMQALGQNYTEELYVAKVAEMGLDKPFVTRYLIYLRDIIFHFDFGTSYNTLRPCADMIAEKIAPTLKIGLMSCCVTVILGIVIGIIAAVKQYSAVDYVATTLSVFFAAMPGFWLALICIMIFSVKLNWLPASGLTSWKHYILPVLCNAISPMASVLRMTRSSMLDVVRQDYIRTARAKGVSEKVVIYKHALNNALIPVLTIVGMQLSMVIGGSIVIETVFTIPGLGMLMLSAINNRDYPLIQGIALLLSFLICVINLLVDLAYAAVDPRIKAQYVSSSKKMTKEKKAKKGAAA